MKKKTKLVVSIILFVFIILVISLCAFYKFVAKPDFIVANTELQRDMICNGISLFNDKKGRLPVNLEEVVKTGYLPEQSNIYYCPMKHNTLGTDDWNIYYTQCEYDISFEPNEIRICIPEKAFMFHKEKFGMHEHHKRCMILTKDGKIALE